MRRTDTAAGSDHGAFERGLEQHGLDLGRLLQAVNDAGLSYLRVKVGEVEVVISRGGAVVGGTELGDGEAETGRGGAEPDVELNPAGTPKASGLDTSPPSADEVEVIAPIAGIFYSAPTPGAAPYVDVGSRVTEETTVCLVEAMKVFTAVRAGVSGIVRRVLVPSGHTVGKGQPLLRVAPVDPSTVESPAARSDAADSRRAPAP